MRLFGPRKPRFEETARAAEKAWESLGTNSAEGAEKLRYILSTEKERQEFFSTLSEAWNDLARGNIADIRKTSDKNEAILLYNSFSDKLTLAWLTHLLDGLSSVVLQQREFMLTLFEKSERNEQLIAKKFEELKASTFTPEQKEIVDAILKGFKDWWMDFLSKGK